MKKAIDLLKQGKDSAPIGPTNGAQDKAQPHEDDEDPTNEGEGLVVMLVESKAALQNAVRDRLKARGYRVLIIADPNRALARFAEGEERPADCVIFGAAELGNLALEAYNQFATDENTSDLPAILLVDQKQAHIIERARRGSNRKLLALPLKVRELRAALKILLAATERREIGSF